MIAIFTVLGLVLFGGGLYGVYDGWPYLVLERGFTEVIIGAIATTAGLIMLSLAWVLRELKGLRRELAAAAVAPLAAPVPPEAVRPAAPSLAPAVETPAAPAASSSPLVPAALGVGAAAVALAVADKAEAAAPQEDMPERDLFGGLVADQLAAAPEVEEPPQDERPAPEPIEALPDMFETEAVDDREAVKDAELPVAIEAESHEPAEIVAAHIQPVSQDEALAHSDDAVEAAIGLDEQAAPEEPPYVEAEASAAERRPSAGEEAAGRDEFALLRESLTSRLGSLNPPAERVEPGFNREDSFTAAEAWMRFPERQEPRFDLTLPAAEDEPAEPDVPLWPPRTEPPAFDAAPEAAEPIADVPASGRDDLEQAPHEPTAPVPAMTDSSEAAETEVRVDEGASAAVPEPSAPEPAASEEGIVGAYQVGEAHFTIYADGSIRARTPDGEYSFASMDELKVYLASEKSRLGV